MTKILCFLAENSFLGGHSPMYVLLFCTAWIFFLVGSFCSTVCINGCAKMHGRQWYAAEGPSIGNRFGLQATRTINTVIDSYG